MTTTTTTSPNFENAVTAAVEAAREVNIHHQWEATYCERTPRNYGCSQERHPMMAAVAIARDMATLDRMVQGVKDDVWRAVQETPEGPWIIAYRPGLLARNRGYNTRRGAVRVANWLKAKAFERGEYIAAIERAAAEKLAKYNTAISAYCEAGRILADECGVLPRGPLGRPWERKDVVTPQLVTRRDGIARAINAWVKSHGDEPVFIPKGKGVTLSEAAQALPPECSAGSFVFTPGFWASPLDVTVRLAAAQLLERAG